MFVHYDPSTNIVAQISSAARPFKREGLSVAVVHPIPPSMSGRWAVDPTSLRPAVTDPVCGKSFDPKTAKRALTHNGVPYHFCCDDCSVKFFLKPDQFLAEKKMPAEPWMCCSLVALPPPPPTAQDVKAARNAELAATDAYLVADRPIDDAARAAWAAYRQALRNLGALTTAGAMIAAWPRRPDGRDAIAELRAKS